VERKWSLQAPISASNLRRLSAPSLHRGVHPSTEVFDSWHGDWGYIAYIREYGCSSAFISASINREKFLIVSIDAETIFGKV